jgi:hypothetical protein
MHPDLLNHGGAYDVVIQCGGQAVLLIHIKRFRPSLLGIFVAACLASAPATANVYQFFTPSGAVDPRDGQPVNASATFTTAANLITVQLTNLLANPRAVSQAISDVFFTAGGLTTGAGLYSPTASYISIADGGTFASASFTDQWRLSSSGGTYHLATIDCSGCTGPAGLIIGPPGAGGTYSNANGSIARNRPHNPFANQTATFSLAVTGATSSTVISNVVFSFGTSVGDNVAAVPIPASVWLFAAGLLGLIGIARRNASARASDVLA